MTENTVQAQLKAIQDRTFIVDVVCKFAVSIDRRRWDDLASCFVDEIDINTIRTGRWVRAGKRQVVEQLQRAFESYTATQHISANHQVVVAGDEAVVVSTLNATHYRRGAPGGEFQQQVGYYEYHLARRGEWLITKVEQFPHWQRGNQAIFDSTLEGGAASPPHT